MKRETKAGLVVTACFLILVGGVFGVKYLQGTPEAKNDPAAVAAAKEKAAAGDNIPAPPGLIDLTALPPSRPGKPAELDPPPGALIPPPSTFLPPIDPTPMVANLDPKKPVINDPAADDPPIIHIKHEDKNPPASPMPSGPPMVTLPPPSSGPMTPAPLALPMPGMSDPPKIELPPPMTSSPPMPGDSAPKSPPPPAGIELAPLPGSSPTDKPKEKDPPGPPRIDLPKTGDMPPKIDVPKPPVDLPKTGDMPPKPLDIPKPPTPDLPKTGDMPPKPLDIPKPPVDLPKTGDTPKPLDPPMAGSSGPKPPLEFPKTPMGPMPPQEAPANSRPIDNQPEPDVKSYDEEWHYCKQQGESLDSISQKYYFSAKYEQALRRYNLDRNPAPVFQNDKPTLQIGQVVKVPPARILERMYPDAVGGMKSPAPAKPTGAGGADVRPAASLGPVGTSGTDTGSAREYTVPRDGMTIKDVARDELGKEDQWHRIFLLNRWVNPSAPLANGTRLFIPRGTTP
jgi:hypothetical protein